MKISKYAAIAVCAMLVGSAFAGSVQWRFGEDAGFNEGCIAYLFEGSDTSWVADAVTGGTFDPSSAIASEVTDEYGEISKNVGTYVSQNVSLYMVVFDADSVGAASNYTVSDVITHEFGIAGNVPYNFTTSFANSTWDPVSPTPPGPGPDPVDPDPVPEPTSVALLALGLAAFGLKRKVA